MPIELEKESKNLNKFIEYVEAQVNYTQEEIKSDLLERGLSEEEATYVMTFYKPHIKQRMFSRSFSFCGRIRRLVYCLSFIFFLFYIAIIQVVIDLGAVTTSGGVFILLSLIPLYWFILAQGTKRCHDLGNSGLYQLIPFYGFLMVLEDGDEGENEYGFDPKGRNIFSK